ncbi:MAG: hypothetical protein ACRDPJ_13430 [Nocardioidaceae bacterium]
MITDLNASAVRRLARAVALTPAVLVSLAGAPALATAPEQWDTAEPVSTLTVLVLLVGVPVALFAIITLLVYVPSLARGEKYTPGLAWRNENEWFGGPKSGVEAADQVEPDAVEGSDESGRGGASARW